MPDPRRHSIFEGPVTDVETNSDARNMSTTEFEMPELQDPLERPLTPSSLYECHSPPPLMSATTDGDFDTVKVSAASPSSCGPYCSVRGEGCKHYPLEHSMHHWRRCSVLHVKRAIFVELNELLPSPEERAGTDLHLRATQLHPLALQSFMYRALPVLPIEALPPTTPLELHHQMTLYAPPYNHEPTFPLYKLRPIPYSLFRAPTQKLILSTCSSSTKPPPRPSRRRNRPFGRHHPHHDHAQSRPTNRMTLRPSHGLSQP